MLSKYVLVRYPFTPKWNDYICRFLFYLSCGTGFCQVKNGSLGGGAVRTKAWGASAGRGVMGAGSSGPRRFP